MRAPREIARRSAPPDALFGVPLRLDFDTIRRLRFLVIQTRVAAVGKQKIAALYARVSTDGQMVDNQLRELRAVGRRMGWKLDGEYIDRGASGAKGRDKRPAFDKLLTAATRREFDVVMAWSVDRLGRSLQHLIGFLGEIHTKGIDLYLHQQGIDSTTPGGKALFQMCGVFAEFERAMIVERVKAGLTRAKAQGKRLGRPRVALHVERAIMKDHARGVGIKATARKHKVGVGTVQRVLARAAT